MYIYIYVYTCIYIYVLYIYIYLYQYRVFIYLHTYIQRWCETINHPIFIVLHELFMFSTENLTRKGQSWHARLFAICALGALSARLGWCGPSGLRSIPACKRSSWLTDWYMALFENGFSMAKSYGLRFTMVYHGLYGLWFFRNSHLVPKAWILRVARFFRVMPAVLIRYLRTRNQVPWAAKTWRTTRPSNFDSVNGGKEIWE